MKTGCFVDWPFVGLAAEIDGKVVAVGGVQRFGAHCWCFFNVFETTVRPHFWHRNLKAGLAACERAGLTPIYSLSDNCDGARRWHERLGFRPVRDDERDGEITDVEMRTDKGAWVRR